MLRAVLQLVPWGADGLSLDLMRRTRPPKPRSQRLPHRGDHQGRPGPRREAHLAELAPCSGRARAGRADRRGPVLRAWRSVLIFWQVVPDRVAVQVQRQVLPGLAAPVLRLPGTRHTPRIALAALEAEAFLVWPTFGLRRVVRKPAWPGSGGSWAGGRPGAGSRSRRRSDVSPAPRAARCWPTQCRPLLVMGV